MKILRPILLAIASLFVLAPTAQAHYDPNIGRWISRDPIGEMGGYNLYAYVLNDGVNYLDYLGMWRNTASWCCSEEAINKAGHEGASSAVQGTISDRKKNKNPYIETSGREYGGWVCCNKKTKEAKPTKPVPSTEGKNNTGYEIFSWEGNKTLHVGQAIDLAKVPDCKQFGDDWATVGSYHSHPSDSPNPGVGDIDALHGINNGWPVFVGTFTNGVSRSDPVITQKKRNGPWFRGSDTVNIFENGSEDQVHRQFFGNELPFRP